MQSETLAQEFARLVKEYHEGDEHTKPEAWNLLADYAVDNADAISAALSDKQAGEVKIKPLEWYPDPGAFPYKTWGAQSSFGRFLIEEVSASDSPAFEVRYTPHHLITITDGLLEAKAAAQADYEQRIRSALVDVPAVESRRFKLGDHVCKTKGSSWVGHVVGFYSTELTPVGYAVESSRERGSVQIYPEAALKLIGHASPLREGEDSAEVTLTDEVLDRAVIAYENAFDARLAREECLRAVLSAAIRALAATRSGSATTAKGISE